MYKCRQQSKYVGYILFCIEDRRVRFEVVPKEHEVTKVFRSHGNYPTDDLVWTSCPGV